MAKGPFDCRRTHDHRVTHVVSLIHLGLGTRDFITLCHIPTFRQLLGQDFITCGSGESSRDIAPRFYEKTLASGYKVATCSNLAMWDAIVCPRIPFFTRSSILINTRRGVSLGMVSTTTTLHVPFRLLVYLHMPLLWNSSQRTRADSVV